MDKLRPVEEVWVEYLQSVDTGSASNARFCETLQADREALRQVVWEKVKAVIEPVLWNDTIKERIKQACLTAGKVDDRRERLGRAAYEANPGEDDCLWAMLGPYRRECWCKEAAAVQAEIAAMEAEDEAV